MCSCCLCSCCYCYAISISFKKTCSEAVWTNWIVFMLRWWLLINILLLICEVCEKKENQKAVCIEFSSPGLFFIHGIYISALFCKIAFGLHWNEQTAAHRAATTATATALLHGLTEHFLAVFFLNLKMNSQKRNTMLRSFKKWLCDKAVCSQRSHIWQFTWSIGIEQWCLIITVMLGNQQLDPLISNCFYSNAPKAFLSNHQLQLGDVCFIFYISLLSHPPLCLQVSLQYLWEKDYQVLVFYHHPMALEVPFLWPGQMMPSPWANTTDPEKLVQFLQASVTDRRSAAQNPPCIQLNGT